MNNIHINLRNIYNGRKEIIEELNTKFSGVYQSN